MLYFVGGRLDTQACSAGGVQTGGASASPRAQEIRWPTVESSVERSRWCWLGTWENFSAQYLDDAVADLDAAAGSTTRASRCEPLRAFSTCICSRLVPPLLRRTSSPPLLALAAATGSKVSFGPSSHSRPSVLSVAPSRQLATTHQPPPVGLKSDARPPSPPLPLPPPSPPPLPQSPSPPPPLSPPPGMLPLGERHDFEPPWPAQKPARGRPRLAPRSTADASERTLPCG